MRVWAASSHPNVTRRERSESPAKLCAHVVPEAALFELDYRRYAKEETVVAFLD